MSKEKRAELERRYRSLRDKRQADRVKAVIALVGGCRHGESSPGREDVSSLL